MHNNFKTMAVISSDSRKMYEGDELRSRFVMFRDQLEPLVLQLVEAASDWENTVGGYNGPHIDAGSQMRDAARSLGDLVFGDEN